MAAMTSELQRGFPNCHGFLESALIYVIQLTKTTCSFLLSARFEFSPTNPATQLCCANLQKVFELVK